MRQLTLIRHAITEWNSSGRLQGQSDVPLSAQGRRQARALGRRLAKVPVVSLAVSSPLARSLETARIALPDREIAIEPRLMELNFGVFQGLTSEQCHSHEDWASWHEDPFAKAAPGGESYRELRSRAVDWMSGLPEVEHVVAFTHSGVIQMLLAFVLGVEHPKWRKRIFLRHTGITRLLFRGDEAVVERVNDTRHLDSESGDPFDD